MKATLYGFVLLSVLLGWVGCSSRSVNTEVTRCVYPDSPRTPAPSFICGDSVSGFPVTVLRSAEPSNAITRDRIQWVLDDQLLLWSEAWSNEWFESPLEIERAQLALMNILLEDARVVRTRTSPKSFMWLLIGIPYQLDELEAQLRSVLREE
jgi:hypothetical protein